MVIKIFKAVWFFSLLGTIGLFLYIYASLPDEIQITERGTVAISRNTVFYSTIALLAVINALVFVITRIFPARNGFFQSWFYGLVVCLNLFIVVSLQFISTYNSMERYDYGKIGYIIYGSIVLIVVWSLAAPVYYLGQRFTSKQPV